MGKKFSNSEPSKDPKFLMRIHIFAACIHICIVAIFVLWLFDYGSTNEPGYASWESNVLYIISCFISNIWAGASIVIFYFLEFAMGLIKQDNHIEQKIFAATSFCLIWSVICLLPHFFTVYSIIMLLVPLLVSSSCIGYYVIKMLRKCT